MIMCLLAVFTKNSDIVAGVFLIFAIAGFVASCATEIEVAFFLMLMIPLSILAFDYWVSEKKEKTHPDTTAKWD